MVSRAQSQPNEPPVDDLRSDDVDDALDLAAGRVVLAQREFGGTRLGTTESVKKADRVVHRAEDLDELAEEAVGQAVEVSESDPRRSGDEGTEPER
jgi:hypothetical protein